MRDDSQIEEMLREAWTPVLPEGMRERVLGRARTALVSPVPHRAVGAGIRWRLLLAGLSAAVVLTSNLMDAARSARIQRLIDGISATPPAVSIPKVLERRREMERLLALSVGSDLSSISSIPGEETHDIIYSF